MQPFTTFISSRKSLEQVSSPKKNDANPSASSIKLWKKFKMKSTMAEKSKKIRLGVFCTRAPTIVKKEQMRWNSVEAMPLSAARMDAMLQGRDGRGRAIDKKEWRWGVWKKLERVAFGFIAFIAGCVSDADDAHDDRASLGWMASRRCVLDATSRGRNGRERGGLTSLVLSRRGEGEWNDDKETENFSSWTVIRRGVFLRGRCIDKGDALFWLPLESLLDRRPRIPTHTPLPASSAC